MVVPIKANTVVMELSGKLGIKPFKTRVKGGAAIINVEIKTKLISTTKTINAPLITLCFPVYNSTALKIAIKGVQIKGLNEGNISCKPRLAPERLPAS